MRRSRPPGGIFHSLEATSPQPDVILLSLVDMGLLSYSFGDLRDLTMLLFLIHSIPDVIMVILDLTLDLDPFSDPVTRDILKINEINLREDNKDPVFCSKINQEKS